MSSDNLIRNVLSIGLNYHQKFLMIKKEGENESVIFYAYFPFPLLFNFRQLSRLEEKMTCDIAMILEVLKARSTGVSAIARDDSTPEPRQIQAAGSDTWPSPPDPAQVVRY